MADIDQALDELPSNELRYTLNRPTGNFFYDPWILKEEFKGTIWEKIYNSMPEDKGEARLIVLEGGKCYISHADIDDRYHLNLAGNKSYLINLQDEKMYPVYRDGVWYIMDAGWKHSAANFGNLYRIQLVIRQRLFWANCNNPINVRIDAPSLSIDDRRFLFDEKISPWINRANKRRIINNFDYKNGIVSFTMEAEFYSELEDIMPSEFIIL